MNLVVTVMQDLSSKRKCWEFCYLASPFLSAIERLRIEKRAKSRIFLAAHKLGLNITTKKIIEDDETWIVGKINA